MQKKIIFNCSLPRSGSELLQVLLHQNPKIYGSTTSPLIEYLYGARANLETEEALAQSNELRERAFISYCKGAIDGYYNAVTDRPIVCDKSRGWSMYNSWLVKILDGQFPKTICMIRDLREVIASFERAFRNNRDKPSNLTNASELKNLMLEERVDYWLNNNPVGNSIRRLYDNHQRSELDNILVVKYEDLTNSPQDTMNKIYDYIGEERFEHDFENIKKEVHEHENVFGFFGNHDVLPRIVPLGRYEQILGKNVGNSIINNNPWFFEKYYPEVYENQ